MDDVTVGFRLDYAQANSTSGCGQPLRESSYIVATIKKEGNMAKRCEICGRWIKENTLGNNQYCQGHNYFAVQLWIKKHPKSKLARMQRLYGGAKCE